MRTLKRTLAFFAILGFAVFIAGSVAYWGMLNQAEDKFATFQQEVARLGVRPSEIYSADGKLLFQVSAEYRKPIASLSEVPDLVKNAVIAAEDKRFYQHDGVDYIGLARAAFLLAREGEATQGGSTLTMQLAKRMVTGKERTIERKLQDIALATVIERRMTKDEILRLYLNQVYFGAGAYGIRAAADVYFGKTLDQLTLSEAAFLARLVQRPPANPRRVLERLVARRDIVLRIMREENMVDEAQYQQALAEPIKLSARAQGTTARLRGAPYAVDHVMQVLRDDLNLGLEELAKGGYRIETTIDYGLQRIAEKVVADVVRDSRRRRVTTGAFVLMDADGKILVQVGGVNYRRNQFNVIVNGRRQPGSSFKPFVYATALRMGTLNFNDSISNERFSLTDPSTGRTWTPGNSNGRYGGSVSLRTAFASSINLPAVRAMDRVGPSSVVAFAHDSFGFQSKLDPVLSLALGSSAVSPLELAQAYSVFMLRGDRATPYVVRAVYGPDGNPIRRYEPKIVRRVFDPAVTDQIDTLMRAVVTSGTGRRAGSVPNARGKTGTTNDNRDAWFCGYTDGLVGIAWIASEHKENGRWVYRPMPGVFGGNVTVNIWSEVLEAAHRKYGEKLSVPPRPDQMPAERTVEPDEDFPIDRLGTEPDPTTDAAPADGTVDPASDPTAVPPSDSDPNVGTTATAPPPAQPKSRPRPIASEETVEVEVCAESGQRASIYCPETVTRTFRKGTEPRRRCSVHGGG